MKKIITTIVILILAIVAWYFFYGKIMPTRFSNSNKVYVPASDVSAEAIAEIASYKYDQTYTDPTYNFSFKYPTNFEVTSAPEQSDGVAIIVQDLVKKIGVQIIITKSDGPDIDLTADIIHTKISDMRVDQSQEILIGKNRKGLAFMSDNKVFGGKSREVWFVYNGNLYQISTYMELDEFLKGLFATWQFKK